MMSLDTREEIIVRREVALDFSERQIWERTKS